MPDRKISQFTEKTDVSNQDIIPILDISASPNSADANKKATKKAILRKLIKTVNGSYVITAEDGNYIIEIDSSSSVNVTIELTSLNIGDTVDLVQVGVGNLTLVSGPGVTVNSKSIVTTGGIGSGFSISKTNTNLFISRSFNIGNEYTLDEKNKLANIEDDATADQTPTEIAVAYESETDRNQFTDQEKLNVATIVDKTDKGGFVGTSQDLYDLIKKFTWNSFISSLLPLVNQTTVFEPYFIRDTIPNVTGGVWNLDFPFTGDYEIELHYRYSYNNNQSNFQAHLLFDGAVFEMPVHAEPSEVGGAGSDQPTVSGGVVGPTVNTGTDQFLKVSGKRLLFKNAGDSVGIKLEFAGQVENHEATIYNASIVVRFIENANTIPVISTSIGTAIISNISAFNGGFNFDITIENTSGASVSGWKVVILGSNYTLTSSGNADINNIGGGNVELTNLGFNGSLADGQSLTFQVQGTTGDSGVNNPTQNSFTLIED